MGDGGINPCGTFSKNPPVYTLQDCLFAIAFINFIVMFVFYRILIAL